MATRNVALTIPFVLWDTVNASGKQGDSANVAPRWIKDGVIAELTDASVVELDAGAAPGLYVCNISATEADCNIGVLCGKTTTVNVSMVPVVIQFERLPNAAPGASGGVVVKGAEADPLGYTVPGTYTAGSAGHTIGTLLSRIEEQVPSGPVIVSPPPPTVGSTTAWIQCLGKDGAPIAGAEIAVRLIELSTGAGVYAYDTGVAVGISNVEGLAYVFIQRGSELIFEARRDNGPWVRFTGVDSDTVQLPKILGTVRP